MILKESLISVVMPTYNSEKFVRESINSVVQQSYQNWELIIVDDCSTDTTVEIIKKFEDNRISLFSNISNSGAAISRNRAIQEAKGKYIAFLDSDDLWTKDKLNSQVNFMQENNYAFTYTNYEVIDENSKLLNICMSGPKYIKKNGFYLYNWIGCLTAMYDVENVGKIQIINIKKRNDYAIWIEISKKHECYLLEETLGFYRKRQDSLSSVGKMELIKSHYCLFRYGKKMRKVKSIFWVCINVIMYFYRGIIYKKKGKLKSENINYMREL